MSLEKKKKEIAKKIPLKLKGVSDDQYSKFINKSKSVKERISDDEKFNKNLKKLGK